MRLLASLFSGLLLFLGTGPSARASARLRPRVAVQPCDSAMSPGLRARIAHLLRAHGYRVVTTLPAVTGTAQYPGLARDLDIAAFVVTDVDPHRRNADATLLIWKGSGDVAARWSLRAAPRRLSTAISRGFWPHLGRALAMATTPPRSRLAPARPMRIDAGEATDEAIVSDSELLHRSRAVR